MSNEHDSDIGRKSRVTLSVMLSAMAIMATGAIEWADLRYAVKEKVSQSEFKTWSFELQKLNPTVNVPVPHEEAHYYTNHNSIMATSIKK